MIRASENNLTNEFTLVSEQEDGSRTISSMGITRLSQVLRGVGALIIIAAASIYLFPRWQSGNDITRYLMLLGMSGAISAAGFFCSLTLKENKGARTLLGLSVAVLPVHFVVLGALLYSQFSLTELVDLPQYATWVAPSAGAAMGITAVSLALLVPLTYLSFLVLGRSQALRLALVFLLANATLLIPVRMADPIGVLTLLLAGGLILAERYWFATDAALRTFEGRLIRTLMVVPVGLLVGRSLCHYPGTEIYLALMLGLGAALLFEVLPRMIMRPDVATMLQGISVVPAAMSWVLLADVISQHYALPDGLIIPLLSWPFALLLVGLSLLSLGSGRHYRVLAALIVLLGGLSNLALFAGPGTALVLLASGVLILFYGFMLEQKGLFMAGGCAVLIGLGYLVLQIKDLFTFGNWSVMALLGILTILGASVLERQHGRLLQRTEQFRKKVRSWDY